MNILSVKVSSSHRPSQELETPPLSTKTAFILSQMLQSRSWDTHTHTQTHRPPGHVPSSQEISAQSVPAHLAWWLIEKTVTHEHIHTYTYTGKAHTYTSDSHPDADSEVEKKVDCYDNNVREAEGLRQVVEVDGGVRHHQCSQQCTCTHLTTQQNRTGLLPFPYSHTRSHTPVESNPYTCALSLINPPLIIWHKHKEKHTTLVKKSHKEPWPLNAHTKQTILLTRTHTQSNTHSSPP